VAKVSLTLDSLGEIDAGAARAIIDREIAVAVNDLDDRGEDGQPRKVAIQLTLKKSKGGYVEAHVDAQAKLPPRRTAPTIGVLAQDGRSVGLMFQESNPDNPDQPTFPMMDNDEE
jgi:hypothetical protein